MCRRNCSITKFIKLGSASKDSASGAIWETWVRKTFKWSQSSRMNIELWLGARSDLNSWCIDSRTRETVAFIVSTIIFRWGSITRRRQSENSGHCLKIEGGQKKRDRVTAGKPALCSAVDSCCSVIWLLVRLAGEFREWKTAGILFCSRLFEKLWRCSPQSSSVGLGPSSHWEVQLWLQRWSKSVGSGWNL